MHVCTYSSLFDLTEECKKEISENYSWSVTATAKILKTGEWINPAKKMYNLQWCNARLVILSGTTMRARNEKDLESRWPTDCREPFGFLVEKIMLMHERWRNWSFNKSPNKMCMHGLANPHVENKRKKWWEKDSARDWAAIGERAKWWACQLREGMGGIVLHGAHGWRWRWSLLLLLLRELQVVRQISAATQHTTNTSNLTLLMIWWCFFANSLTASRVLREQPDQFGTVGRESWQPWRPG